MMKHITIEKDECRWLMMRVVRWCDRRPRPRHNAGATNSPRLSRSSIVVSTLRCGRRDPGSIPGTGRIFFTPIFCSQKGRVPLIIPVMQHLSLITDSSITDSFITDTLYHHGC